MTDLREKAARALCRKAGNPENTQFEGKPMWMSYLDEVDTVMSAFGQPVGWGHWEKGPGRRGRIFLRVTTSSDEADSLRENGVDVFPLFGTKDRPNEAQ